MFILAYSKREIDLQNVDDNSFYLKHTEQGLKLSNTQLLLPDTGAASCV